MVKRKINIAGRDFEYKLRKRRGVRSVRLSIHSDGSFAVTAPKWYPIYAINIFIKEKCSWIVEQLRNIDQSKILSIRKQEDENYKIRKEEARKIICARTMEICNVYGLNFKRIFIKNQKSCWGSCSAKRNLNFNYKVAFLPSDLRDYIITHEVCHLEELNHSHRFWKLVSRNMPDYMELRQKLRKTK